MPVCRECGNTSLFASAGVSSEVPYANPPLPLQAVFTDRGDLSSVEYTGNEQDLLEQVWAKPEDFFDTCSQCGSTNINW